MQQDAQELLTLARLESILINKVPQMDDEKRKEVGDKRAELARKARGKIEKRILLPRLAPLLCREEIEFEFMDHGESDGYFDFSLSMYSYTTDSIDKIKFHLVKEFEGENDKISLLIDEYVNAGPIIIYPKEIDLVPKFVKDNSCSAAIISANKKVTVQFDDDPYSEFHLQWRAFSY